MYRFGDCAVDTAQREVRRAGERVHLEPQAFELLVHLIEHRDRVVAKHELLDGVWGHRFLSEANLTTRVKEVRRAVGDDGARQAVIANVRGHGYRFVAELAPAATATRAGLVGRERELAALRSAVEEAAFVSIVGAGGVGKTALARRLLDSPAQWPGGGHFVDLGRLRPGTPVLPAVALAAEVALDVTRPSAAVQAIARLDALVVLDNCEHVVEEVVRLVEDLLAVPGATSRLVATSRVRLGVPAEHVVELVPLGAEHARELFDRRASAARADWARGMVDPEAVDRMLASLDRLPLAIEMAAARLGSMTFRDVAAAIDDGAPILQLSHRGSAHRHRSLESLVTWSVDLLDPDLRGAFEDLAVFAAPVTASDAAAVLDRGPRIRTMLADLADRSLLVADLTGPETTYRMLDTVRTVAARSLAASDRSSPLQRRHAAHIVAAIEHADRRTRGVDELPARLRAAQLVPELRVAHRWACAEHPDLADRICASVQLVSYTTFWGEPEHWARELRAAHPGGAALGAAALIAGAAANRGDLAEAIALATAATAAEAPRVRALGWEILGDVALYEGSADAVERATVELARLGAELGDTHHRCIATVDRALGEVYLGDPRSALLMVDAFEAGSCGPSDIGWLRYTRGEALAMIGDGDAAAAFESALDAARSVGNALVEAVAALSLATVHVRRGDLPRALDRFAECLTGYARHGNFTHALTALRNLAEPLLATGDLEDAIRVLAAASSADRRAPYGADTERLSAVAERARQRAGDERFRRWWDEGRRLDLGDAVRLASAALSRARGAPSRDPQRMLS